MATHVLVVEGDPGLAELVCDTLRDSGFNAEHASTDLDAYRRLTHLPSIDALVQDVNLGQAANGYEIARFARQVIPEIAVIYVSGTTTALSYRAFAVPDSVFLEKPFDIDALVLALRQYFGATRSACLGIH